jgi:flagella basal body P-ring formation protein FlgA
MSQATSFVSALLILVALSGSGFAQSPDGGTGIPAGLERRVAERVAGLWDVPFESLHLQWGRLVSEQPIGEDVPFRLIGRGADGWFAVSFEPSDGSPAAVRVRVGVEDTVLVAARPLLVGTELTPGDIERSVRVSWRRARSTEELDPGVGWVVRRPIAAGQQLASPAVSRPYVIAAGEPVQLTWNRGAVTVSMTGMALNAARIGERVRARVAGRSTHVSGIAVGPGTARLKGGDR